MKNSIKFLAVITMLSPITASAQNQDSRAEYPGFSATSEEDSKTYIKEENSRQRFISKCMKQQKFEYHFTPIKINEKIDTSERGKARKKDKGELYLASLSDSELSDYNLALYGIARPDDPETAGMPTDSSCVSQAAETYPGVYSIKAAAGKEYRKNMKDVANESDVRSAHPAWASCMASKGHAGLVDPTSFLDGLGKGMVSAVSEADRAVAATAFSSGKQDARECAKSSGMSAKYKAARGKAKDKFMKDNKSKLDKAHDKYKKQPKL